MLPRIDPSSLNPARPPTWLFPAAEPLASQRVTSPRVVPADQSADKVGGGGRVAAGAAIADVGVVVAHQAADVGIAGRVALRDPFLHHAVVVTDQPAHVFAAGGRAVSGARGYGAAVIFAHQTAHVIVAGDGSGCSAGIDLALTIPDQTADIVHAVNDAEGRAVFDHTALFVVSHQTADVVVT